MVRTNRKTAWLLTAVVVVASACSSTPASAPDSAAPSVSADRPEAALACTFELEDGALYVAEVEAALDCDADGFRAAYVQRISDSEDLRSVDDDLRAGSIECVRAEFGAITDAELLDVAEESNTADDFAYRLGVEIGRRCQSTLPSLGSMSGEGLIGAIIERAGGAAAWTPVELVDLNPGIALSSVREGYRLFVALDPEAERPMAATLVFQPALVEVATGEVLLSALLTELGVEISDGESTAVLRGESSPLASPVQVCTGADNELVVVIVQPESLACQL